MNDPKDILNDITLCHTRANDVYFTIGVNALLLQKFNHFYTINII